jgi:hypothetical protein
MITENNIIIDILIVESPAQADNTLIVIVSVIVCIMNCIDDAMPLFEGLILNISIISGGVIIAKPIE